MILSYTDPFDKKRKNHRIKATVTTEYPGSSYTQPLIVLETGGTLDFFSWRARRCRVAKATKKEFAALEKMGLV
jgi:hypothetical protein